MSQYVIGVMSGTSLDAVDVAAVTLQPFALIATHSVPFSETLYASLLALTQPGHNEIERMGVAAVAYGQLVADAVQALLDQQGWAADQVQVIGCHGQTIRHRPDLGFSLQIGDANQITERTGIAVVSDFRQRDVAAHGQGAPLVPAFHRAIWQHPTRHRVVLNIGGMANVSVLPAGQPQAVYGFDTGPGNVLMDSWCLTHTGQPFDESGAWAAQGQVHAALLAQLQDHGYFALPAPKSTGRESFCREWLDQQLVAFGGVEPVDVQATLLALTAWSIAEAIGTTGLCGGELWLCGGGAYNHALWQALAERLPGWSLHSSAEMGMAPQWVEACAFAWLAAQRLAGKSGNLPAVTGALGPRVLGALYHP